MVMMAAWSGDGAALNEFRQLNQRTEFNLVQMLHRRRPVDAATGALTDVTTQTDGQTSA